MPVRFTSPSLGGQRNSFLQATEWQVGAAYRRLAADQWYVGKKVDEAKAPFGQPLFLEINSLDLSVAYGVSDRLSLTLTLPFSYGTHSRFYADTTRHKVRASGLGDVNLVANLWLFEPASHPAGDVAVAFGIKAPTGNYHASDSFFLPNAPPTKRPVDQSIQLGDGGWGGDTSNTGVPTDQRSGQARTRSAATWSARESRRTCRRRFQVTRSFISPCPTCTRRAPGWRMCWRRHAASPSTLERESTAFLRAM